MHADMTAVTIQSNKIVSGDVKDNYVLANAILQEKSNKYFAYFLLLYNH